MRLRSQARVARGTRAGSAVQLAKSRASRSVADVQLAGSKSANMRNRNGPTCGLKTVQLAYSKRSNLQDPLVAAQISSGQSPPTDGPKRCKTAHCGDRYPFVRQVQKWRGEIPRRRVDQGLIGQSRYFACPELSKCTFEPLIRDRAAVIFSLDTQRP